MKGKEKIMKTKKETVSIKISIDLHNYLKKLAEMEYTNVSAIVRKVLMEHFKLNPKSNKRR